MFPDLEPFDSGMLDVGDSQQIYWECSGNPKGRPIVYLHGGPGSGAGPHNRRYFDPNIYKIVLTDQRGCGRSQPHVETLADLEINTTAHLIADLERLREHLGIDRWAVLGISWGTTLGLAYAQAFPHCVRALVLACVTTTSRREVQWITHDIGRVFPEQWERFASAVAYGRRHGGNLANSYTELVFSPDATIREQAARQWCEWEATHVSLTPGYVPNPRYKDPAFRLLFSRLVTHYWAHAAFLEEDQLIRNVSLLSDIPGILIQGRYDVSTPLETAWRLQRNWPRSALRIVDDVGHGGSAMCHHIVEAIKGIATVE